jgi:hypothetical protein
MCGAASGYPIQRCLRDSCLAIIAIVQSRQERASAATERQSLTVEPRSAGRSSPPVTSTSLDHRKFSALRQTPKAIARAALAPSAGGGRPSFAAPPRHRGIEAGLFRGAGDYGLQCPRRGGRLVGADLIAFPGRRPGWNSRHYPATQHGSVRHGATPFGGGQLM